MTKLRAANTSYVRCIKPNSVKVAGEFEGMMTLQQLTYSGVFEAVSIRKSGFPFRYEHQIFYQRYKLLVLKHGLPHYPKDYKEHCQKLIDKVSELPMGSTIDKTDLQMGRTMVLYRSHFRQRCVGGHKQRAARLL